MCPVNVQWPKPTSPCNPCEPFLDNDITMNGLKSELLIYMAAAEDVVISAEEKKVEWLYDHKEQLPHWATVQPISATIIRCNKESIPAGDALVDYLQASIILQYKKR